MSEALFRKAALDKVSSPDQLDLLMRVTSPLGWLALLTMVAIVAVVGVWAFVGSIADLVDANGTLFRGERLYEVTATMTGSIVSLSIRPGATVTAGQTIASLKRVRAASEQRDADAVTIEKNRAMANRLKGQLGTLQRQWQLQKQRWTRGSRRRGSRLGANPAIRGRRGSLGALSPWSHQLLELPLALQRTELALQAVRHRAVLLDRHGVGVALLAGGPHPLQRGDRRPAGHGARPDRQARRSTRSSSP